MKHVVLIPITGYLARTVEASSEDDAVTKALDNDCVDPVELQDLILHETVEIDGETIFARASVGDVAKNN